MSNKTNSPAARRTPMSLSGSVTKSGGSHKGANAVHSNSGASGTVNGVTGPNANSKGDNKNQQNKCDAAVIDLTKEVQSSHTKKSSNSAENKKDKDKTQNGISSNKANNEKPVAKEKQTTYQNDKQTSNKIVTNEQEENIKKTEQVVVAEKTETAPEIKDGNKSNDKEESSKPTEKSTKLVDAEGKIDIKENATEQQVVVDIKNNIEINNPNKPAVVVDTANKEIASKSVTVESSKERTPSIPPSKSTRLSSALLSVENSSAKSLTAKSVIKPPVTVNVEDCTPMEVVENNSTNTSPKKKEEKELMQPPISLPPTATSTPGKFLLQKRNTTVNLNEVQLPIQSSYLSERPRKPTKISGRRSIHSVKEYTPSKTYNETQYTQTYRRINNEFDDTNSSLNVTVGSTLLDNSLSSFYLGRKRERTLNVEEEQINNMISPRKKARIDIFGLIYSPITMLRNRLSKTTLKSSTPVKLETQFNMHEDNNVEVQNVSGISVDENDEGTPLNDNENVSSDNQVELDDEIFETAHDKKSAESAEGKLTHELDIQFDDENPIEIKETPTADAKQKRCIIM